MTNVFKINGNETLKALSFFFPYKKFYDNEKYLQSESKKNLFFYYSKNTLYFTNVEKINQLEFDMKKINHKFDIIK